MATALKAIQAALAVLQDMIENDGKSLASIIIGIICIFFALLMFILIPVVIHERVPVTATKEQAVWYWQAAKEVTEMTESPCDPGVYVDWQQVIAIDAVRLEQNFKKSSSSRAKELAKHFVEQIGICTHCTGSGDNVTCHDYPTYRLKTIDEVMTEVQMSDEEKKAVKEKYLVIRYDFLIGFKSQTGSYNELYSGEMKWPITGHNTVSSPYGIRKHPISGASTMHYGIDIPAPEGTLVLSPADGTILSYEYSESVGWTMKVDHGLNEKKQRITTRYCHLSEKIADPGQTVKAGDAIAKVGSTGYLSTGPHLHFELYVDGVTCNPADYFQTSDS